MLTTINTRIKSKVDDLVNWLNSSDILLDGEIAIVRVPTGENFVNPVTGQAEPVVELLMKVGDGEKSFRELPWVSGKSSDVYNWAKQETASSAPVKVATGTSNEEIIYTTNTLGNWIGALNDRSTTIESDYVRCTDDKLYAGKDNISEIIFDCGNADSVLNSTNIPIGDDTTSGQTVEIEEPKQESENN